ncbi:hypothetical protein ACQ4LE_008222, partial [Meloidogyne hapla]
MSFSSNQKFDKTFKWRSLLKKFSDQIPQRTHYRNFLAFPNSFTGREAQNVIFTILPTLFERDKCTMMTSKNTLAFYLKNNKFILNVRDESNLEFEDNSTLYRLNWSKINKELEDFELDYATPSNYAPSNPVRRACSLRASEEFDDMGSPPCKKSTSVRNLVGSLSTIVGLTRSSSATERKTPSIKRNNPKFLDENVLKENQNFTNISKVPTTSKSVWNNNNYRMGKKRTSSSTPRPCSVNSSQNYTFCQRIDRAKYEEQSKSFEPHLFNLLESILADENLDWNSKINKLKAFRTSYPSIYL